MRALIVLPVCAALAGCFFVFPLPKPSEPPAQVVAPDDEGKPASAPKNRQVYEQK